MPLLFLVPPKDISAILTTLVRHSSTQNLDSDAKILPFNRRDLLWIGLIVVAASWTFFQSYQKWLDPIIDVGRDLYIPGELLNGEKLYRDVLYIYPPLTPYLLSSITWMFGNRLPVYIVLGVIVSASVVTALYFVARTTIHQNAAGVVALLFVTLNFTGTSSWGSNFIFPFAHAATFGTSFFLLYLAFITLHLFVKRRPGYYFLAFAFGLLASWTKIEFALSVTVTLITIFIVYGLPLWYLLYSLLIGLTSLAAVSFFFYDTPIGHHWLWDNIFPHLLLKGPEARFFYAQVLGIDELGKRTAGILNGALLIAIYTGLLAGIDRIASGLWLRDQRRRNVALAVLLIAMISLSWQLADDRFFRAWALLQILLVPLAALENKRSPLLLLLLFSLCNSIRIYFNLAPVWYGFYLILATYLLIAYFLFRYLPERGVYSSQTAMLWIPMFLLIMTRGQIEQAEKYSLKAYPIKTAQGRFYDTSRDRATTIQDLLHYLEKSRYSGLVVMPEGLTLNYFSGIGSPLSFHTFTPIETANPEVERRILEELERFQPELIAINDRDVTEFGRQAFGVDYNRRLIAYLQKHYFLLRIWDSPSFKLALLRRPGE